MTHNISKISKVLLIFSALLLIGSIFVPLWRIELDAPQYPEGLVMQIFTYKIGGQVDIINGLNHYIGMQTLHAENFIEFTILPYIIGAFALLILISGIVATKKMAYISFWSFLTFGVISMIDFWRWEYNYGHHLDPSAAIIVPGMTYQPPLIGFKQLLNFGAYSVPDIGGWLFVAAGLLMLIAVLIESGFLNKIFKKKNSALTVSILMIAFAFSSCNNSAAQPIKLNKDKCDYCAMTIADGRFGSELITKKGRCYKFDDLQCMLDFKKEKTDIEYTAFYASDYNGNNQLVECAKAFYVKHESLRSPMGGNYAAFVNKDDAAAFGTKNNATMQTWTEITD